MPDIIMPEHIEIFGSFSFKQKSLFFCKIRRETAPQANTN